MEKKRIVVVDDNTEMRDLMKAVLAQHYDTVAISDPALALDTIRKTKPHLVLLDLNMPGMSGWTIYNAMRDDEDMEDIPVIIVTASKESLDRLFGLHIAHVTNYLTKPFLVTELLDSIAKALEAPPD